MSQEWQFATKTHIPVMPKEVLSHLNVKEDGIYVDGTIGLGGHSQLILSQLSPKGRLIGVDRDAEALEICKKRLSSYHSSLSLFNKSYHKVNSILDGLKIEKVNGILLDLGLSSLQLGSKDRGFSYKTDCDLDMRFDRSQKKNAFNIVNNIPEKMLADLIYFNSEEKRSRAIARKITSMRPINKVFDLVEAIKRSTPPFKRDKTISRVFQAIRISVNNELEKLDQFLSIFYPRLLNGGRIVIISFHSLEDRKVKHAFKFLKSENKMKILTKKPLIPSEEEVLENSRSKSAKLRAAER
tara:strand:+ start:3846 stop:4736 length:891 start_codon:yes stop_codon:yes gene_type:complete